MGESLRLLLLFLSLFLFFETGLRLYLVELLELGDDLVEALPDLVLDCVSQLIHVKFLGLQGLSSRQELHQADQAFFLDLTVIMTEEDLRQDEDLDVFKLQLFINQIVNCRFLATYLSYDSHTTADDRFTRRVVLQQLEDLQQVQVLMPHEGLNHALLAKADGEALEYSHDDLLLCSFSGVLQEL